MKNRFGHGRKFLSIAISWAILFHFAIPAAIAQVLPTAQAPATTTQTLAVELNIVVVEGEGAILDVHQRLGRDPVVRIEDENHQPINGATVVFTLPTEGATGVFATGLKSVTVTTDARGMATGKGLKINQVPGKLQIHVTVSYKGLNGRTNIVEFVEGPAIHGTQGVGNGGKGKWIAIVVLIGGGAAGGAVYAMSKKSATPAPPGAITPPPTAANPIGLTPGTGSIAPPH